MNQIILSVAIVVLACGYAHTKCDMMKDFKTEFDEIKAFADEQCKKNGEGTPMEAAAIAKAKTCYDEHLKPALVSDNGKIVDAFALKHIFENGDILKVCYDKDVQEAVKNAAMKDIGVSKGMKLKQEVEKDPECNPFKKHFQGYNACVKAAVAA